MPKFTDGTPAGSTLLAIWWDGTRYPYAEPMSIPHTDGPLNVLLNGDISTPNPRSTLPGGVLFRGLLLEADNPISGKSFISVEPFRSVYVAPAQPVAGEWYVDKINGDNANDGMTSSTAFADVDAANAALTPGDTVFIMGDGVVHRQNLDVVSGVAGSPTTYKAFGTDEPIFTGAELLTGLVPADASDDIRVGAIRPNLFVSRNMPIANIADNNPRALNIYGDGQKMHLAIDWDNAAGEDRFFEKRTLSWHNADSTQVDASGNITGYVDASITDKYTQAQIENAWLQGHYDPNVNFQSPVTSFVGGVVSFADAGVYEYETNDRRDLWSLLNILPNMVQGDWGWWDNGDGTVDIYVWPRAGISNIEYSARTSVVDINAEEYIRLDGLRLVQSAGFDGPGVPGPVILDRVLTTTRGIEILNCYLGDNFTDRDAVVRITNADDLIIKHCEVRNGQGCFGLSIRSSVNDAQLTLVDQSTNLDIQHNLIAFVEDSPLRGYTMRNAVIADNDFRYSGRSAHSNLFNFYQQCDTILFRRNRVLECDGFGALQEASDIVLMFNIAQGSKALGTALTSRTFVDQQNATPVPNSYDGLAINSHMINNTWLPAPQVVGGTADNGMTISASVPGDDSNRWLVHNNIFHGWRVANTGQIIAWNNNVDTSPSTPFNPTDTAIPATSLWVDPANDDFNIDPASPINSLTGLDLVAIDAALMPIFGDRFTDWTLDALGNTFDPANPPIGAVAGYDYSSIL